MRSAMAARAALVLASGVLFAAAAGAAPAGKFGLQITALMAEAAKEGRLQLSWSGAGFANNGKDVPHWLAEFNKFYGFDLPYTYTPAPSMPQQAAAMVQAAQSNTPAASDDIILGADPFITAVEAHATRPYDWAALLKELGVELPRQGIATGNAGLAFSTDIFGIVYSKNAVSPSEAPKTLEDVLKPEWKGRIASTPYAAGFNNLASFDPRWPPARMDAFVAKLAQQIGGLSRCSEPAPLLSGQFDMMVLECDVASAIAYARQGMPLGYVVPEDAPITQFWYLAVPKTAPEPAAGALFALFMLTNKGQALSWESDANDLVLLPGSHSAALLPGKTAMETVQDLAAHPETVKLQAQYIKILTGAVRK